MNILRLCAFLALIALLGCVADDQVVTPESVPLVRKEGDEFHGRLLEIADTYTSFDRADRKMRITGVICAFTPHRFVSGLSNSKEQATPKQELMKMSDSTDSWTHGKKLFFLYAKYPLPIVFADNEAFPGVQRVENPIGQAVVKEAWIPEEVKDDGKPLKPVTRKVKVLKDGKLAEQKETFVPYARKHGRLYHAKEMAGLFIMFKVDPEIPGTDNGWVYGTVTADGKTVTGAGRLESCMKCHQKAPFDRIFGLPKD